MNKKPKITKIKFSCDEPIYKKLNEYELTKDFMNQHSTTTIIGFQNSGKTSLTINFTKILYKKCFRFI